MHRSALQVENNSCLRVTKTDFTTAPYSGVINSSTFCKYPPRFASLHRLAVNNHRTGAGLTTIFGTPLFMEYLMKLVPDALLTEMSVIIMNSRPRRKVTWEHPPGAPCAHQIQNTVNHLSQIRGSRPTTRFGRRKQLFDHLPLLICQVTWICGPVHIFGYRTQQGFSYTFFRGKLMFYRLR